jgi:hypothetical protein
MDGGAINALTREEQTATAERGAVRSVTGWVNPATSGDDEAAQPPRRKPATKRMSVPATISRSVKPPDLMEAPALTACRGRHALSRAVRTSHNRPAG